MKELQVLTANELDALSNKTRMVERIMNLLKCSADQIMPRVLALEKENERLHQLFRPVCASVPRDVKG